MHTVVEKNLFVSIDNNQVLKTYLYFLRFQQTKSFEKPGHSRGTAFITMHSNHGTADLQVVTTSIISYSFANKEQINQILIFYFCVFNRIVFKMNNFPPVTFVIYRKTVIFILVYGFVMYRTNVIKDLVNFN